MHHILVYGSRLVLVALVMSAPAYVAVWGIAADQESTSAPFDQKRAIAELEKRIAGQEQKPAEEVFKDIQTLKGVPAGRLLKIMELGYARSLGVDCTHCHVPGTWESNEKPKKQIAREMSLMVRTINSDMLAKIQNLESKQPVVNCTTCHRGQTKPALNLP